MTRTVRSIQVGALTLAVALASASGQAEDAAAVKRVEVGQEAPDFTLPDPDGKEHTASALRGEKNLLLVFFRGTWWPFCRQQLGELQEQLEAFEALETVVWSISPDKPDRLRSYRDEFGITIPLLVDADSATIEAYGVLNARDGKIPHPTVVLVDREGKVRFFHLDENFRQRPPVETLLDAVREIETEES